MISFFSLNKNFKNSDDGFLISNLCKTSQIGIDLIKKFENFSSKVYTCPAGYKTIGYGHVIKKGEKYTEITKEEAELLLTQDIKIAENSVIRNINVPINNNQFAALVSFTFNLGGGALQSSSLRQKINYDPFSSEIEDEFLKWVYVKGRRMQGLIHRRIAESNLYFSS